MKEINIEVRLAIEKSLKEYEGLRWTPRAISDTNLLFEDCVSSVYNTVEVNKRDFIHNIRKSLTSITCSISELEKEIEETLELYFIPTPHIPAGVSNR